MRIISLACCVAIATSVLPFSQGLAQGAGQGSAPRPATPAEAAPAKPAAQKPQPARAANAKPVAEKPAAEPAEKTAASRYCSNIENAAAEARFAVQREALANVEISIAARMKTLEDKRAEYEEWYKRRMAVLDKADDTVLRIYAGMKAEAAASQIAAMDDEVAAGLLTKLKPRTASAIFNEMDSARAAQLANIITDAPHRPAKKAEKQ